MAQFQIPDLGPLHNTARELENNWFTLRDYYSESSSYKSKQAQGMLEDINFMIKSPGPSYDWHGALRTITRDSKSMENPALCEYVKQAWIEIRKHLNEETLDKLREITAEAGASRGQVAKRDVALTQMMQNMRTIDGLLFITCE